MFVSAKEKDILLKLLELEKVDHHKFSGKSGSSLSNVFLILKHDMNMFRFVRKNKIDLVIGTTAPGAHVSKVTKAKSVFLCEDDRDVIPQLARIAYPFTDYLLTPDALPENNGKKHIKYPSYQKLAYLHPDVFKPDTTVLEEHNINIDDPIFLLRFSSLNAHHDRNISGIPYEVKKEIIRRMEKHGSVYISSELSDDPLMKKYSYDIPINKFHHLLGHCSLFVGDSQSMSVETGVMGVPNIRCNSFVDLNNISVIRQLKEKYNLINDVSLKKVNDLQYIVSGMLDDNNLQKTWDRRRSTMLEDKINFSQYLHNFIEGVENADN